MYSYRVLMFLLFFLVLTIAVDLYFFYGIKTIIEKSRFSKIIKYAYWAISGLLILFYLVGIVFWLMQKPVSGNFKIILQGLSFCLLVPKFVGSLFFLSDDIIRLFRWLAALFSTSETSKPSVDGISRLKFLQITGLGFFALFAGIFTYGVLKGGYNLKYIFKKLKFKNLPKGFNDLKIVQISDLHVGSFLSKQPVQNIVDMINQQNPDMVFFTGDLVNDIAEEALEYVEILKQIKAKYGVFSTLGNHDYGDYYYSKGAPDYKKNKQHNLDLIQKIHADCGWRLLMDENVIFESEGGKLAVIGVQNWSGTKNFSRYGDLYKAAEGTEDCALKLLLSHDPSHWEKQILPEFPSIDATFSGHTHGMQFGVEIPGFRWSPSKYVYKQWAGLYQKNAQSLYVNRGAGFIGYPGRVGIFPEISVFTLVKDA